MNFLDFLLKNYIVLFEMIGLLIILFISSHISLKMKNYTRVTILLLFIVLIVASVEKWTQSFDHLNMWRPFLTATKYTLYPVVLIFVMLVFTTLRKNVNWKIILMMFIPIIILIPIYYTSQWSHFVFYYLEDNTYKSGTVAKLPYVVFCIYLAIFLVQNIIFLKHYSIKEKVIMTYIIVGSIACVLLYLIGDYEDDYTLIFITAIAFYYLFLYIHMANIDPLTKLLNRQSYYLEIENNNDKDAVISVDMNELKYYNDIYGHDRGDQALVEISNILKENSKSTYLYRVGGDEFVILYKNVTEEEIKNIIIVLREKLKEKNYSCAFGYSMKQDRTTDMIKIADFNMYKDKQAIKKQIIESGGVVHDRHD